jgi:hypothetical protein
LPTATKAAEITAFGGYTVGDPDFGGFTKNGFTLGSDFTLFPHWHVDPSVEVRFNFLHAPTISEHSFLVGPRLQEDFLHDRLHPYVNFLVGAGTISYHPVTVPNDSSDSGRAYSIGGGADFDITRHISVKGDVQQGFWNLGTNSYYKPQGGDYTLSPRTYTFGVTYHFIFRGLNKQQELR